MSIFRDTVADLLRESLDDVAPPDLPAAISDLFAAVKDAVGEQAFADALPVGTVLITVEGGIAEPVVIPAGVQVRIVDIDTDTTEPDDVVHDSTAPGPVGDGWALLAIDERIERLTAQDAR